MSGPGGITDAELLRAVLNGAAVRIAVVDRKGHFLLDPDPNPPNPSDGGAPPGVSFTSLYGDVPGAIEAFKTALAGEETRLTREVGGETYVITFRPRRDTSGEINAIFVAATVLSQKTELTRALAETQARAQRIFNAHMTGLLYWNESGAITDANDAFLHMLGYSREELAGGEINWRQITPPEHLARDEAALGEIRERGSCTPFEKDYVRKDGSRIAVLIGGSSWERGQTAGVAFVVDISERKRHERERDEAAATLRRVAESAPLVLWAVDTNGKFTLSIGRGLARLGLRPGQVLGQSAYELYAGVPAIAVAIQRALRGEEFSEIIRVGELAFETMLSPLHGANSVVTGVLGVSIDVTERLRAEAEQEQLRAQLLQVQKLESLGLLAGGIAHDFNNILSIILGGASTALLTLPIENPARSDIEHVIVAAQRAASLTRQMLAYSGKAHVEIRAIDLSLHVNEIASLLETTLAKKVQLRLELESGLPAIEADVAQVQQIVMNLVINGAEAIGDQQGTVLVTTGVQLIDEQYADALFAAEGLSPGDYVFLEVHDTGHGMDEVTKAKIFDPFFTTKFTGRGLGLAAVAGIVRSHRGAIKVYSSPGKGTTFKVFFPTATRPAVENRRRSMLEYRGHGLVLVIDDDRGVRSTARRMLEFFGFSVIEAADGQAGADVFATYAADIVLVLLDMTMPKMSGEETFRVIRGVRDDVPVILTSGYNEIEATRRFTSKGLAGFLEKPFTPTDLAGKLASVLKPSE